MGRQPSEETTRRALSVKAETAASQDVPLPDAIAGYDIEKAIHRGGQGVVYRAVQKSTRRKVAIKVMREGPFAGEADKARFDREIVVLGQLNHPNIVTIHDSGQAAGSYYLVMDLVRGEPLDAHVSSKKLSVESTVRLFAKVCAAVNAAHLKGIIHRDLKPGNILVDADGEPRILDFGLAKVAAQSEASAMTRTGLFVGSLPWASPEQVEGVSGRIDMRTDVYSLGVILYQLLTGRFPYDVQGSMPQVMGHILNSEPVRPRAHHRRIGEEVETIVLRCLDKQPERRYQSAGELARDLTRFLDGQPIEAKRDSTSYVLRKYLRRHRLAVAVAAGFVLVLATGLLVTFSLWRSAALQRDRAEKARQDAESVTAFLGNTLALADPSVALSSDATVMRAMLDQASKEVGQSFQGQPEAEARLRTIIGQAYSTLGQHELAVSHLRRALEIQDWSGASPEELYDTIWPLFRAVSSLGGREWETVGLQMFRTGQQVIAQTQPQAAQALDELFQPLFTASPPNLEAAQQALARIMSLAKPSFSDDKRSALILADLSHAIGWGLWSQLSEPSAEEYLRQALRIRRRQLPEAHPETAAALSLLVEVLNGSNQGDKVEELVSEAIEMRKRVLPPGHWLTAESEAQLGESLVSQRRYAEAEELLLGSYRTLQESSGPAGATTALRGLIALDEALGRTGQAAQRRAELARLCATSRTRVAWPTLRSAFGPQHQELLEVLERLRKLGSPAQTERNRELQTILKEYLPLRRKLLPEDHPLAALIGRQLLARTRDWGGWQRPQLREEILREVLSIARAWERQLPNLVGETLEELSHFAMGRGDFAEAEGMARESWILMRSLHGESHWLAARSQRTYGECLLRQKRHAEAEPLLAESYRGLSQQRGETDDSAVAALNLLLQLYQSWGRPEKAGPYVMASAPTGLDTPWELAKPLIAQEHAGLAQEMEKLRESLPWDRSEREGAIDAVIGLRPTALPLDSPLTLVYAAQMQVWGQNCVNLGGGADCEALFREALAIWQAQLPPLHPKRPRTLWWLSWVLADKGALDEAEARIREALGIRRQIRASGHWLIASGQSLLARILTRQGRYPEAEAALLQAHPILADVFGETGFHSRLALGRLVDLYIAQGRLDEAARYWRREQWSVLSERPIAQRFLSSAYPELAAGLNSLLQAGPEDSAGIAAAWAQLRPLAEAAFAADDPAAMVYAERVQSWAESSYRLRNSRTLAPIFEEVLDIRQRHLPEKHLKICQSAYWTGLALVDSQEYAEAVPLLRKHLTDVQELIPAEKWSIAQGQRLLGIALERSGRYSEAEPLLLQGYAYFRGIFADRIDNGPDFYLSNLWGLVRLYESQGRWAEVRAYYPVWLDRLRRRAEHPRATARDKNNYAWNLLTCAIEDFHDPPQALAWARQAAGMLADNAAILNTLGIAQYRAGLYREALDTLRRSDQLNGGNAPEDVAFVAMCYQQLGRHQDAQDVLTRLRRLMTEPGNGENRIMREFANEAEALIAGQ